MFELKVKIKWIDIKYSQGSILEKKIFLIIIRSGYSDIMAQEVNFQHIKISTSLTITLMIY